VNQNEDLFEWSELVHSSDGATAHAAALRADQAKELDRQITWALWNEMFEDPHQIRTRSFYQFSFLPGLGLSVPRAKSLTRRLSDLVSIRTNANPNLWLLEETGAKVEGSAVLALTERGKAVEAEPKLMVGVWNQSVAGNALWGMDLDL
jgi:hypothetical protein